MNKLTGSAAGLKAGFWLAVALPLETERFAQVLVGKRQEVMQTQEVKVFSRSTWLSLVQSHDSRAGVTMNADPITHTIAGDPPNSLSFREPLINSWTRILRL